MCVQERISTIESGETEFLWSGKVFCVYSLLRTDLCPREILN